MFTKPTIFSMNPATGQARCAGEAGDELMIGKETMLNMISQASGTSYLAALLEKLDLCKFCSNGTPILKSAVHSF